MTNAAVETRPAWTLRAVQVVTGLALAAVPLAFGYAGYGRRWAGDDGFINLRVVSQLLHGHGFVYNVSERCEAVTSAGWIFFLALLGAFGIELDTAAWTGALTLSVLGLALAAAGAARLSARDERTLLLPFGIIVYAAIPVAWDYATSALENGIGLSFLGGAYCGVAYAARPTRYTRSLAYRMVVALFVGCAPMMRPDYLAYVPPLLALLVLQSETWRERAKVVAATAVSGLGFQIFRMGYFAALVPNTAIAKEAFESHWQQGWLFFLNMFSSYQLWIPLSVVALALVLTTVAFVRREQWQLAVMPVGLFASALVHMLYVVRVGGDFMHGRMLLPAVFAMCCSVAAIRVRLGARHVALALAGFTAVSAWALYCADRLRPPYFEDQVLDERRWYSDSSGAPHPTHLKHYDKHHFYVGPLWAKGKISEGCKYGLIALADDANEPCKRVAWPDYFGGLLSDQPDGAMLPLSPRFVAPSVVAVYGMRPIGIIGRIMGSRIDVIDLYGLADPLASRVELPHLAERGRPGHEKTFPTPWFVAKFAAPEATKDVHVQQARQALGCGLLKELLAATHEPLTVGRFLRNIGLSFSLHRLRVPADPALAVERFCKNAS